MKPNPTASQARLDAAINARNEARLATIIARGAETDAESAVQAANLDHRVNEAAAYLLAEPKRLARVRELVARGGKPGPANALDRSMSDRHAGLVTYEPTTKGLRYNRTATAAPGHLAAPVLALIDAPESAP